MYSLNEKSLAEIAGGNVASDLPLPLPIVNTIGSTAEMLKNLAAWQAAHQANTEQLVSHITVCL